MESSLSSVRKNVDVLSMLQQIPDDKFLVPPAGIHENYDLMTGYLVIENFHENYILTQLSLTSVRGKFNYNTFITYDSETRVC